MAPLPAKSASSFALREHFYLVSEISLAEAKDAIYKIYLQLGWGGANQMELL